MDTKELFNKLYFAQTEDAVDKIVNAHPDIFKSENWLPLGKNENNFAVIENQQSTPIAALIEKITNSIDAVLMRKCLEAGIDSKSDIAPRSMEEAKVKFFPNHTNWDLVKFRNEQAESIQISADGPKRNTSLIIYDDGEGQHPEDFETTFLSLLRGNKNEIKFVQGKYNMGGSGAIVFCGKKRYQLIGSKRYDNSGHFGFTLIRKHPLSKVEENVKKNTWYEYLAIDGKIPAFDVDQQDLGLFKRKFKTGTIIKLYSYDVPRGISDISRDLNQSINEYLFEPVLPIYTIENEKRYPQSSLRRGLYGLKHRLEQEGNKYVEDSFSEEFEHELFGKMKVTCYVFNTKIDDKSAKETKDAIRREFFKNDMSVLFSINGQVHGHYRSEFITKSLKFNLLKEHLLIHVDCTNIKLNFRNELFMASRDRLKVGKETGEFRSFLANKLRAKDGRLWEIYKQRRNSIAIESEDTKDLLKSYAEHFAKNEDLLKLLGQMLNLDIETKGEQNRIVNNSTQKKPKKKVPQLFNPKRFPTFFKHRNNGKADKDIVSIPIGGEKTILFDTDVENNYFDRTDEPGELKIAVLDYKTNETRGGNAPGKVDRVENIFNVRKSSPKDGTIKIHLDPKKEIKVDDETKIKVSLADPTGVFEELFWIKISESKATVQPSPIPEKKENPSLGLPDLKLVHQKDWEKFGVAGETMDYSTIMYPNVEGEKLETIYINMDSTVLKNFRGNKGKTANPSQEYLDTVDQRYISTVYFHTLFLYSITKTHKYKIMQEKESNDSEIDIEVYLKNLFETHYAEFPSELRFR